MKSNDKNAPVLNCPHATHCVSELEDAREWLLTGGEGSYALGSQTLKPMRRYHGWLIAAENPPVDRAVLLSMCHLTLSVPGQPNLVLTPMEFHQENGDVCVPPAQGPSVMWRGRTIVWRWQGGEVPGDAWIELRMALGHKLKSPALSIQIASDGLPQGSDLCVRPLLAMRDHHAVNTSLEAGWFAADWQHHDSVLSVRRMSHAVTIQWSQMDAVEDVSLWWRVALAHETPRGQEDSDVLYAPGQWRVEANTRAEMVVSSGDKVVPAKQIEASVAKRGQVLRQSAQALSDSTGQVNPLFRMLALAADDFVVQPQQGKGATVLAGYPWFTDWGRDTFIALPGLLLSTGRVELARDVLSTWAAHHREGMMPNRFEESGDISYNSVDATFWFLRAALLWQSQCPNDPAWQDCLAPLCAAMVEHLARGTYVDSHTPGERVAVTLNADGLVVAGHNHSQLTWMDAACGGEVFTPRAGACVEINALWVTALKQLSKVLPNAAQCSFCASLAKSAEAGFRRRFAGGPLGGWRDVVDAQDPRDEQVLRPNQWVAYALGLVPNDSPRNLKRLYTALDDALAHPAGMRTLAETDERYHSQCIGDMMARDRAYHQGTVWPWIGGFRTEAWWRLGEHTLARSQIRQWRSFISGPGVSCVGHVAEIFDDKLDSSGSPVPRGCPAQAWSVSELLRVMTLARQGEGSLSF